MARRQSAPANIQSASGTTWNASKTLLAVAIGLFVLTRFYLLFCIRPQVSDMLMYYEYAIKGVDFHDTPYTEEFVVPYPPLAFWTTLAPRYVDDRRLTSNRDPQIGAVFFGYDRAFRGMMFMCDLASFALLLLIVRKRRPQLAPWAALLYVITTTILGHVLYDRLDVALLLFMIAGLYCWTRSCDDSPWAIPWDILCYAVMGLGISFKIIPILCVPFFLLADFYAPRQILRLTCALAALATTISVPFLIQWSATGPSVFGIFKFHAEREVHLESLYSSLMSIAAAVGSRIYISQSHGAFNLSGDLAGTMKIVSSILLLGFLFAMGLWAVLRFSRLTRQDAYRMACYAVVGSVILSIVLSPQYFVWAIPLVLLLAVEILPPGIARPLVLASLLILVAATTTWVFPCNFFSSQQNQNPNALIPYNALNVQVPPNSTGASVLALRNFAYLGVAIWLGVMLYKRIDKIPDFAKLETTKATK
jgi:hypothetical protein